jgi:NAD+ synthase (glutamine-hydrolysing)
MESSSREVVRTVRLVLSQVNVTVGDIPGNSKKVLQAIDAAKKIRADIVVVPELAIPGYPPEDLLLHPAFVSDNIAATESLARVTRGIVAIVGYVERADAGLYNAAAVFSNGRLVHRYRKIRLPNYGVFDEKRYFGSGDRAGVFKLGDARFGLNICEDIWYPDEPIRSQCRKGGASLIINISSSPYHALKPRDRETMLARRAADYRTFVAYCNLVGGQDELVFDGMSMVLGPDGQTIARGAAFKEDQVVVDLDLSAAGELRKQGKKPAARERGDLDAKPVSLGRLFKAPPAGSAPAIAPYLSPDAEMFEALVLGLRDYVRKNGFKEVVLGLSGGIDSTLVACVAVEALGSNRVAALSMPSMFSTEHSKSDADKLAKNLGIALHRIPIHEIYDSYVKALKPLYKNLPFSVAEENLQARARGNLLMGFSNKFGHLVLTTGDKSEMSMGYSTLYGDMAGGLAAIRDVYKTRVYQLCRYFNHRRGNHVIPLNIFSKAPSPELRPNQKAQDTLPPYDVLDPILECYIEHDLHVDEIVKKTGASRDLIRKIVNTVDHNEYKRRQAPPGIKVTPRAFGKDRRFPITNLYRV